jgi:transposase
MVGVSRIEIKENAADLKQLMHEQKSASAEERLHSLYLLKTQHTSITEVAELLGRHRVTVQRWLQEYEQGGLNALLAQPVRQGPPSLIPETVQVELVAKLIPNS